MFTHGTKVKANTLLYRTDKSKIEYKLSLFIFPDHVCDTFIIMICAVINTVIIVYYKFLKHNLFWFRPSYGDQSQLHKGTTTENKCPLGPFVFDDVNVYTIKDFVTTFSDKLPVLVKIIGGYCSPDEGRFTFADSEVHVLSNEQKLSPTFIKRDVISLFSNFWWRKL